MNPYQYPATCAICGESGYGHVRDTSYDWLGASFVHQDRTVCIDNMAAQKRCKQQEENEERNRAFDPMI